MRFCLSGSLVSSLEAIKRLVLIANICNFLRLRRSGLLFVVERIILGRKQNKRGRRSPSSFETKSLGSSFQQIVDNEEPRTACS